MISAHDTINRSLGISQVVTIRLSTAEMECVGNVYD